ncbi:uncharacterized protein LY89DRAFT_785236 [Mollisia scopiformis]|uniref:ABM domain-containing protein n=1 Tax=Mollisia scopiformis TaxID=149040 RepID=A0A194X047_MOLSC|nr:uncharacterized protein LY89DRAFT_785236 [Mollisia scopiformis]KUJ13573.1 hypothetical protein LY89DRAFT_785236 [Mollisia scopiformis]
MPPITKIWFAKIKPSTKTDSPEFHDIWTTVLQFCNQQSGKEAAGHTLWQDINDSKNLIFISGYPSQESTDAADSLYVKTHAPKLMEFVENDGIVQLSRDVTELPIKDAFVSLGLYGQGQGGGAAGFEKSSKGIQSLLQGMEGNTGTLSGKDEWPAILRRRKGLAPDTNAEDTVVVVSGWKSDQYYQSAVKRLNQQSLPPRKLSIYKKIME